MCVRVCVQYLALVDVDLVEDGIRVLSGELVHERRNANARTAPRCEKVNNDLSCREEGNK